MRLPVLLGCALLVAVVAPPAQAFELLAWWKRDLIGLSLEPGDWARYAVTEVSEEGAVQDTLTVTVFAAGLPDQRWLRMEGRTGEPVDFLLVEPGRLREAANPLDAVLRLVRRDDAGNWQEEDLDEHRESRIVQRHLEDPFENPTLQREALSDTTAHGVRLTRERVRLTETRREERKVGRNVLVLETELRSVAELSAQLPVAGILEARTVTLFSSRTETADGKPLGRSGPPLLSERTLRCLAFGRLDPPPTGPLPR